MITAGRDIKNSILMCLASEAGAEYDELKYLDDLSANSFQGGHDKRYGVRPGATPRNDLAEVNRAMTYTQTFEFVLTKGCYLSGVSDTEKYEAFLDLHQIALSFNSKIMRTKAGLPGTVLHTLNFTLNAPEFLNDDKVAVLTGNVDVIYRLTL